MGAYSSLRPLTGKGRAPGRKRDRREGKRKEGKGRAGNGKEMVERGRGGEEREKEGREDKKDREGEGTGGEGCNEPLQILDPPLVFVPVCKISGLSVQRLQFVTPFKVTDRQTDRPTDRRFYI